MPRGASPKREREYDELKERFKEEGRYKGRETEVAARIVNKQRAQYGETKGEKLEQREGTTPDRGLPIRRYRQKTIAQVEKKLPSMSKSEIQKIEHYEQKHKRRKTLVNDLEERLEKK